MKWTSLNDLREKYLAFFESKDDADIYAAQTLD